MTCFLALMPGGAPEVRRFLVDAGNMVVLSVSYAG
jgi:hypothetical protein